jgi:hypothetical protein
MAYAASLRHGCAPVFFSSVLQSFPGPLRPMLCPTDKLSLPRVARAKVIGKVSSENCTLGR